MVRKVVILITSSLLLYLLSFIFVVSAPVGILDYSDWDDRIMVIKIYSPVFDAIHYSNSVRDTCFNICSLTGNLENFVLLYGENEIYMVDVYYE
ncbi:hypothetical protein Pan241w_16740 [Gimesia alba]|uniref:Transmembrane protein n=1 Tax=Gimesia alba TaxID=2527973 RepID=A0A517RCJ8_9PLAN|nr:hypothetical protein Pan241w_16740 [Gimesia alba]